MNTLLAKEQKRVFSKMTPHAANILAEMYAGDWQQKDVVDRTGIDKNRLSELRHYYNYPNKAVLNEGIFRKLLEGGIVRIDILTKKSKLTEAEKAFVESYRVNEKIFDARQAGLDPAAILQKAIEKAEQAKK